MEGDSLAASRSRRQKSDKHGRLAALTKISQLKGGKHKCDIREEVPVYDLVTEEEYAKNVQDRQEDDWIVDDGTGYAEDGREIFDDDEEDDAPAPSTTASKTKKSFAPPTKRPDQRKSNDIKSMFMAIPAKKKPEKEIKVDDDELLRDIMKSVSGKISPAISAPKPTLLKKRSAPIQESPKTFRQPSNPFGRKRLPRVLEEPSDSFLTAPSGSPHNALRDPSGRQSKRKLDDEENISFTSNKTVKIENRVPAIEGFDSQECRSTDVKIEDSEATEDMTMDADCSALLDDVDGDELEITENMQSNEPIVKTERNYLEEKPEANLKESTFQSVWESPSSSPSQSVVCDANVDSSHLPMTKNDKDEEVLQMYWLDAYEDYFKHPGVVYLFGKVFIESGKTWVSCCIVVKNISRKVLLLKREKKLGKNGMPTDEPCDMNDVYLEFREAVMDKYKISEFKCKPSTKLYSFEKEGVPYKGDYLEVIYSADCPQLPMDLKGKTFSHIFGTNTSSLEQLLIDRKMKGPFWLEIKNPSLSNPPISWCKLEAVINNPSQISVLTSDKIPPPPPLVVMALTLKTCLNQSTNQNEIVAVACLAHLSFPLDKAAPKQPFQSHFCAITKPSNMIFPYGIKEEIEKYKNSKVERMESERSMLNFVLGKIHKTDPDLIVGHDIVGFDIKLLLHRLNDLKISQWSRLGRLRRTIMPKINSIGRGFHAERTATCGRLVCDIQVSAKELIRSKSYDLSELVGQVLHQKHCSVPQEHVNSKYEKASELIKLVDSTLLDGSLILKLMCELNVLPLALQITNIAGNLLSRTLLGGRSERNEYLLLHAFHEKNFICPDKNFDKSSKKETEDRDEDEEIEVGSRKKGGRKKPSYAGGLVLDPKKGFYDKYILLMDFNSLYPSIIQEYNICFTTVAKPEHKPEKEEEELLVELPDSNVPAGVLPTEIRKLVESRRQVKQMMKAPNLTADLKLQYDIRQKALKLTANSMYGCLGFSNSRFYAKQLAALVTGKGREVLLHTKELVQKMGLEVIYGDTDSIMINSNCLDYEEVMKLGIKVKNEVNKLYRQLELDVDGLYKPMLLLKKKKYAALSISKVPGSGELIKFQEMKGLDTVRRDWSDLAKNAGTYVIGQILSDNLRDEVVDSIHTYLQELGKSVKSGQTPLSSFIINKQLTKNPEDYPDKKNLAHVQVAMRMNSKSGKKLKQGDTVFYVICQDGTNNSAIQRSYHPDELTSSETLQIDTNYYLSQQVLPVVSRLCEPIDGMDTPTLAEFLGLDPTSYKQQTRYQNRDEDDTLLGSKSIFNDENRFVDCEPLRIVCPNSECGETIEAKEPFKGTGIELECSFSQCPSCKLELRQHISNISNQLIRCIRQYINQYYLSWFSCEDPSCSFRTRKLGLRITRSGPICPCCEKSTLRLEYTESQLYLQLACFQKVLDISDKVISKLSHEKEKTRARNDRTENEKLYRHLKTVVDNYQKRNAYGEVVLSKLFQGLFKPDLGTN